MAGSESVSEIVSYIGAAVGAVVAGIAGAVAYFRKPADGAAGKDLVVASAVLFSDRALMERLIATLTAACEGIDDLNELLRADAQRRHDEEVVRRALKDRGIIE